MSYDPKDPSLAFTLPFQLTKKLHRETPAELSPEDPKNSTAGKIIVITGGGSGIGAAAAKVWVRAGAEGVVIAGRRNDVLERTLVELEALGGGRTKVLAVQTDISKESDTSNLFEQVKKTFGRPADVVLANAAYCGPLLKPHQESTEQWWSRFETNVLGLHNVAVSFIKSQPNPDEPTGTIISVNSAMGGVVHSGTSAYSISKLASQRYIEYLNFEYPTLRVFSLLPGLVATDMVAPQFLYLSKDGVGQVGALASYLASPRADYLRGSMTSINWDIHEMEDHKEEIGEGALKISWLPVLPVSGGHGF
ncbi:short chain dehydrogenase-like protein [Amniculicola lignicola CBS 123094]|uniref:Short chain dehydrogenase-like protein n=1 Tax=Amniculicola lignicola CBS 123094 TaxID=1392246 RepID=A0A6A5X2E7_9PLEO|nr:short chain dehydrogenase-like protein [Amniculicola lignicola CBS 123094]